MLHRVVLGGGVPLVGPQEELRYPRRYRGFTSKPGREAKQRFSGFVPKTKQTKDIGKQVKTTCCIQYHCVRCDIRHARQCRDTAWPWQTQQRNNRWTQVNTFYTSGYQIKIIAISIPPLSTQTLPTLFGNVPVSVPERDRREKEKETVCVNVGVCKCVYVPWYVCVYVWFSLCVCLCVCWYVFKNAFVI